MRFDKYDPVDGGFRAPLAADWAASPDAFGVGLDTNGRVVKGAGTTGVVGVCLNPKAKVAGDVVDVMTDGEVVEVGLGDAGAIVTADTTTGVLGLTAPDATHTRMGFTVEATRLIVRARRT